MSGGVGFSSVADGFSSGGEVSTTRYRLVYGKQCKEHRLTVVSERFGCGKVETT